MRTASAARGIAHVASRLLVANPGRLIVLAAGAVSVALATSGIVLAASASLAIVRQTVDDGWRGTYDLLIRPSDAPSLAIGGQTVVPLDYLGLQTSGISRQQWQQIAQMTDIEVAAPVAALGWLKNAAPNIGVELRDARPGVVYAIDVSTTIGGESAAHAGALYASPLAGEIPLAIGIQELIGEGEEVFVTLGYLPATWGMVVGIDPSAEDALIGLSDYVQGPYLTAGTHEVFDQAFDRTAIAVPVLTAANSPIPGDLVVTVSMLEDLTPEQVNAALAADPPQSLDDIQETIDRLVAASSPQLQVTGTAELRDLLRPLREGAVTLGTDGRLTSPIGEASGFSIDDNIVLVPSLAGYLASSAEEADLALEPLGSWQDIIDPQLDAARPSGWFRPQVTFGGDAIVYRDLHVTEPPAFKLLPNGTYDRTAIDRQFAAAANYAPLGVYAEIPRILVTTASGEAVDQALPVSINPAGINPQPPIGLTNLEAVEALRGEFFIDAIRIRVSGITGYTPEAVRRIENVAQQIVQTTGLHVDVIAGSSPVDLRVAVPGVGIISERWTTLGTAAEIVSGAEGLSAALLAAAIGVVVAYLAAFGVFLTADQAAEAEILRRLGWRRGATVSLIGVQAAMLGAAAAGLTVALVVVLASAAGQRLDGVAVTAAAAVVLFAHPLAAGLAGFLRHDRHRTGSSTRARPRARRIRGVVGLGLTFAGEGIGRAVIASVATLLALTLAGLVAVIEIATGGELRATFFGQAVAVRVASYHLLAAAAAVFAAGALILDGALLTVERRLPLIGILRAVGWRSSTIRRLVTLETATPALLAGLAAAVVVGSVAALAGLGIASLVLGLGVLISAVLLVVTATQLPTGVAVHAPPAATLRAEGASGMVGGFAPRQALLAVGGMVLIVSLVAGGWGAAEGAASALPPFVAPTEHPLSPVAAQIRDDVAALTSYPDREPASASYEGALGYVEEALLSVGYTVEQEAYLSPRADYLDAHGEPVAGLAVSLPAIAYNADAWNGRELMLPAAFFDASGGQLPSTCPSGIAVLRVADYGQIPLAQEFEHDCGSTTSAVLAVQTGSDEAWTMLRTTVEEIRLPVGHLLTASSPAAATSAAPWIVVTLDSTGPGASQSAAPIAAMLALARKMATEGRALRIAVVGAADGAAASVLPETLAAEPAGPIVWFGAMGGPVAPVLGTTELPSLDRDYATAGLIWIARVRATGFADWLARATRPSNDPTSINLLVALSEATGLTPGADTNLNEGALFAGLDAAWLGEPEQSTVGTPSIAGTPADTADQVRPRDLEQLVAAVSTALLSLETGDEET